MNKKAYQSPTITILGGVNNITLGSGIGGADGASEQGS